MYVYRKEDCGVYAAGFFSPEGEWVSESDHPSRGMAAARVHYLNGGIGAQQISMIVDQLASWLSDISAGIKDLKTVGQND